MSYLVLLLIAVLALLWALMAAPVGRMTVRRNVRINADTSHVWSALDPFGDNYGWNGAAARVEQDTTTSGTIHTTHEGRDGEPIRKRFAMTDFEAGRRYTMRITDDTALASTFWANYSYRVTLEGQANGITDVTISETDRYRGLAFVLFRCFALRRFSAKLRLWAETGSFRKGGIFEHPATQLAMAALSAFLLWPVFGLNGQGLIMALALTLVVALHELGHMAAFRMMGHKTARMIFLPLLGGIALGGRPYDRHFEVAFAALMGPGLSVFALIGVLGLAATGMLDGTQAWFAAVFFVLVCGFFNLANLLPVWKFDGGQVLRQVFRSTAGRALGSAAVLAFFVSVAVAAGLSLSQGLIAAAAVLVLSVLTGRHGVKPKKPLVPMRTPERAAIIAGLTAVCVTHALGALWAWNQLAL